MKTTFDCDRTFDRLTAGPLLAGSPEAAEIDAHIASCEACRNLANALRPATHLVHEALVDGGLPVYVPPEERHVQRVMASIESLPLENADSTRSRENGKNALAGSRLRSPRPGVMNVTGFTAGVACAALLLCLVFWRSSPANFPNPSAVVALNKMTLPVACRSPHSPVNPASAANSQQLTNSVYQCCTQCHAASNEPLLEPALPPADMSRLVAACTVCHYQ